MPTGTDLSGKKEIMNMAFDGIVTKAIASELQQLSGARIDKIFQPNSNNVVFRFLFGWH